MASIRLEELVAMIKASPRYVRDFEGSVPADQSLRIILGDATDLQSEVFPTGIGSEVILDVDRAGKVWRIEIF
jgi:hypothetical protein